MVGRRSFLRSSAMALVDPPAFSHENAKTSQNWLVFPWDVGMPPLVYRIRVKGQLASQWSEWLGGMTVTLEANGDTTIAGPVFDQPALHARLVRIRDLGRTLLSLTCDPIFAIWLTEVIRPHKRARLQY